MRDGFYTFVGIRLISVYLSLFIFSVECLFEYIVGLKGFTIKKVLEDLTGVIIVWLLIEMKRTSAIHI